MQRNRRPRHCLFSRFSPLSPLLFYVAPVIGWAQHQPAVVIIAAMLPSAVVVGIWHHWHYNHQRRCNQGCRQPPPRPEGPTPDDRITGGRLHHAGRALTAIFWGVLLTYTATAVILIPLGGHDSSHRCRIGHADGRRCAPMDRYPPQPVVVSALPPRHRKRLGVRLGVTEHCTPPQGPANERLRLHRCAGSGMPLLFVPLIAPAFAQSNRVPLLGKASCTEPGHRPRQRSG